MPGRFMAVYRAGESFVESFATSLREELVGTGISVTLLRPDKKEDHPDAVAEAGFDALMAGVAARSIPETVKVNPYHAA